MGPYIMAAHDAPQGIACMTLTVLRRLVARARAPACILLMTFMAACGRPTDASKPASPGDAAASSASNQDSEKVLNVYSWLDYIAPDTVANFEKETGIKV
ncbi:MAG: hypothetical protein ABSH33_21980, partial [Steroidobacteraceae bacterium]